MPFKSRAQRRKFAELLVEGKISPETYEEWNRETGAKRLPERLKRSKSTARKTSKSTARKTPTTTGRKRKAPAKRRWDAWQLIPQGSDRNASCTLHI